MKKTAVIRLDNIKDSDGWFELANDLGLPEEEIYKVFMYGEYGSITIVVDEDLSIIGGKVHKSGK